MGSMLCSVRPGCEVCTPTTGSVWSFCEGVRQQPYAGAVNVVATVPDEPSAVLLVML